MPGIYFEVPIFPICRVAARPIQHFQSVGKLSKMTNHGILQVTGKVTNVTHQSSLWLKVIMTFSSGLNRWVAGLQI